MKIKFISGKGFKYAEHDQIKNVNIKRRIKGTWHPTPPSKRIWECEECTVEKGDVVVEVGADVGIFAVHAGACGASKYIGFEPNMANFTCAKYNAGIGRTGFKKHATVFNYAVCDTVGTAAFFEGNGITAHGLIDRGKGEYNRPVTTVTLDWLFDQGMVDHIDFLKCDCNGGERAVFDGLSDDNLGKIKKVSMQYHHVLDDIAPGWYGNFRQRISGAGFKFRLQTINEFGDSVLVAWRK